MLSVVIVEPIVVPHIAPIEPVVVPHVEPVEPIVTAPFVSSHVSPVVTTATVSSPAPVPQPHRSDEPLYTPGIVVAMVFSVVLALGIITVVGCSKD